MSLVTILIVVLIVVLVVSLPQWPHAAGWGPYPAGVIGVILLVLLILLLTGRIG